MRRGPPIWYTVRMKKPTNIGDKKAMQKAFIAKAGPNADVMRQMMDCTEGLYFYMKDADGRIMVLNRNNCELCNIRDEEDAIGRTSAELFPHAFAKDYMDLDREVIATGQPVIKRVTEYPADKSFRLMESNVWPLRDGRAASSAPPAPTGSSTRATRRRTATDACAGLRRSSPRTTRGNCP